MKLGNDQPPHNYHQSGASLVVGLVILTLLTVLGLVSTSGHLLQQKALAAGIDREHALHAAERALEWGESLLQYTPAASCTSNCDASSRTWQQQAMPVAMENMDAGWWRQHAMEFGTDPMGQAAVLSWPDASTPPRVVIEEMHKQGYVGISGNEYELRYYRVYANGYSISEDNHVIIASTIAVPYSQDSDADQIGDFTVVACPEAELRNPEDNVYIDPDMRCGRLGWRELY